MARELKFQAGCRSREDHMTTNDFPNLAWQSVQVMRLKGILQPACLRDATLLVERYREQG